jgi:hypothetical protein
MGIDQAGNDRTAFRIDHTSRRTDLRLCRRFAADENDAVAADGQSLFNPRLWIERDDASIDEQGVRRRRLRDKG